ncbi:MAG: SRPBCC domain-containing protein [Alphaproteobacteria bacterium]|nr:SRPBCC domain-containing protein [Alphaproteobacteria bacterium]
MPIDPNPLPTPFGRHNKVRLISPHSSARVGESTDREYALEIKRDVPHPIQSVWHLMTEPEGLAQWAPFDVHQTLNSPIGQAIIIIQAEATDTASRQKSAMAEEESKAQEPPLSLTESEILACQPPHLVAFNWGGDHVQFRLTAINPDLTEVTLTHYVTEPDWLTQVAAGWHICLDVAVMALDDTSPGRIVGNAAMKYGFAKLHQQYLQKFTTGR